MDRGVPESLHRPESILGRAACFDCPGAGETLFLYLSACNEAVSAVLVREDKGAQMPIYYVSRALEGPETRYTPAEKLVLVLVHAARKLRPYFQAHSITVLTDQPLRQILTKPEISGRMTKWAVELAEHDIGYQPRTSIKAQALTDFLAEGTSLPVSEPSSMPEAARPEEPWVLFVDGASSKEGSGTGLLLTSPTGEELTYAFRFDFPASNNEAEYETLLTGLRIAHQMGVTAIRVRSDSQLVVYQVRGEYEAKEDVMKKYLAKVQEAIKLFDILEIDRVPSSGVLPKVKTETRRLQLRAAKYAYAGNILYRRSYLSPWLKCVTPDEGDYVLREVHEGLCAAHVGSRVLAKTCLLLGYYWPSVFRDASALVQKCRACQVHAPLRHQPTQEMVPIHSSWPFAQWGIDLLGPFFRAPGRYEHLVVAIDYFTKWMEAEPLVSISGRAIQKFFWKNIVCRFGILHVLISDNGRQFAENTFKSWCAELEISQHFTSVGHPQANGQVENVNRTILQGLKTRLELAQSNWLDELPSVLWAYRTTPRTATQETPFSLTYGTEAVVPAEIGLPSLRTQNFVATANEEELRCNLDLLEAKREEAAIRMAKYKSQLTRYHNARVRSTQYQPGDLVLRKNSVSPTHSSNKLDPNWEGPYKILESSRVEVTSLSEDGKGFWSDRCPKPLAPSRKPCQESAPPPGKAPPARSPHRSCPPGPSGHALCSTRRRASPASPRLRVVVFEVSQIEARWVEALHLVQGPRGGDLEDGLVEEGHVLGKSFGEDEIPNILLALPDDGAGELNGVVLPQLRHALLLLVQLRPSGGELDLGLLQPRLALREPAFLRVWASFCSASRFFFCNFSKSGDSSEKRVTRAAPAAWA
nr:uncharacterized protein LOC113728583 [Coffea arabica]